MPFAEATNLLDAMRDLLAQMPGTADALTVTGVRRGGTWKVQGSVPAQRAATTYEPCGCLTNDEGAHRGNCPDYQTRVDVNGARYWSRRAKCCGPWAGSNHAPTCEVAVR